MQAIFQVLYVPHGQCRYRTFLSLHKVLLDHSGLDWTAGMRVERNRRIWEMLGGRLRVIWGWIGYGACSRWGVKVQTEAVGHGQSWTPGSKEWMFWCLWIQDVVPKGQPWPPTAQESTHLKAAGTADCLLKNLQLCICLLSNPPSLGV